MDIVDDGQLMKLASHRPHPMLPVLNRTESIKPVILLLAALPGMIVLASQPSDRLISRWGLRAVDALTASDVVEAVAPGRVRSAAELRFQPPLATWLTVGAMKILGPAHPLSASIVSYFAAAGVLGMAYVLLSRLVGGRVGFWTVVLLASHPHGLELYRTPAAVPLTLALAMVAFWGVVRHRDEAESSASVSLLIAGLALGLCVLSGGLAALVVAFILGVTIALQTKRGKPRKAGGNDHRKRKKRFSKTVIPLLAVSLTAFAVAGWWLLMLGNHFGSEFWLEFFFDESAVSSDETAASIGPGEFMRSFVSLLGVFGVASLIGLGRAIGIRGGQNAGKASKRLTLVVVWAVVAAGLYAANAAFAPAADWRSALAGGFLLIPLMACAAKLVDDIFQRLVGLNFVALVTLASLLVLVALPLWVDSGRLARSGALRLGATAAMAAVVAGIVISRYASQSESRRRFAIGGFVGVLLVCNVATAMRAPYDGNRTDERELKAFLASLPKKIDVDRCVLIAGAQPPVRLEFAVRSRWPEAEFSSVRAWNAAFQERAPTVAADERTLVVEWMTAKEHPTKIDLPGYEVTLLAKPRYYQHRDLRAFYLRAERPVLAP